MRTVRIAILGAGNLGTTLGIVLAGGVPGIRAGKSRDVVLWSIETDVVGEIRGKRLNTKYLPGATLPKALAATSDLAEAIVSADILLFTVPSRVVRDVARKTAEVLRDLRDSGGTDGGVQ